MKKRNTDIFFTRFFRAHIHYTFIAEIWNNMYFTFKSCKKNSLLTCSEKLNNSVFSYNWRDRRRKRKENMKREMKIESKEERNRWIDHFECCFFRVFQLLMFTFFCGKIIAPKAARLAWPRKPVISYAREHWSEPMKQDWSSFDAAALFCISNCSSLDFA